MVAAQAFVGAPGPIHAKTVALSRAETRNVAVPAQRRRFGKPDDALHPWSSEKTEIDALRGLGEDRKVHAAPVEGCSKRKRLPRPNVVCHRETASLL